MHSQSWIPLAWGQSCAGEIGKAFSWYTAASRPYSSYPSRSCCHVTHVSCWWLPVERDLYRPKSGREREPRAMACSPGWLTACHSCPCLASFSSDTYQRSSHMRSQDHGLPQRSSCLTHLICLSLPRAMCWNAAIPVSNRAPAKLDHYQLW